MDEPLRGDRACEMLFKAPQTDEEADIQLAFQVLCRAAEVDRARLHSLEEQLAVLTDNSAEHQHEKAVLLDKIKQLEAVIAEQNARWKGRKLQQLQQLQQLQLLQQENARLQQQLDQRACDMALQQHEMTKLRDQLEEQTNAAIASRAMEAALRERCGKLRQQFESLLHELNLQAVLNKGDTVSIIGAEQGSSGGRPLGSSAFPSKEAGSSAAGPPGSKDPRGSKRVGMVPILELNSSGGASSISTAGSSEQDVFKWPPPSILSTHMSGSISPSAASSQQPRTPLTGDQPTGRPCRGSPRPSRLLQDNAAPAGAAAAAAATGATSSNAAAAQQPNTSSSPKSSPRAWSAYGASISKRIGMLARFGLLSPRSAATATAAAAAAKEVAGAEADTGGPAAAAPAAALKIQPFLSPREGVKGPVMQAYPWQHQQQQQQQQQQQLVTQAERRRPGRRNNIHSAAPEPVYVSERLWDASSSTERKPKRRVSNSAAVHSSVFLEAPGAELMPPLGLDVFTSSSSSSSSSSRRNLRALGLSSEDSGLQRYSKHDHASLSSQPAACKTVCSFPLNLNVWTPGRASAAGSSSSSSSGSSERYVSAASSYEGGTSSAALTEGRCQSKLGGK